MWKRRDGVARTGSGKRLAGGAAALLMLAFSGGAPVAQTAPPKWGAQKAPAAKGAASRADALSSTISYAPMLARVLPSVVTIRVIGQTQVPVDVPPRRADGTAAQMPTPPKETFRAGGSGVIVDSEKGHILTNYHVIENANWVQVALSNGRRMMAEVVGRDIGTDIAVLKVEEKGLQAIAVGDSDSMLVGDVVAAIGNPFGLEGTATLGIVSAINRTAVGHGSFEDFLQIDAPINPGNSGGALVNVRGELIGINTATGGGAGTNLGIGFAIPINMALVIKDELVAAGRMRRGSPGLLVEDLPPEISSPAGGGVIRGAIVTKVLPGSSAAAAGIKQGDIVVAVGNKPVRTAGEYITRTVTVPLGTKLPFLLFADGKGKVATLEATDVVLDPEPTRIPDNAGSIAGTVVGEILLGNPYYGDVRGVQIMSVIQDSPAFKAGLEPDDIIVGLDSANVRSVDELLARIDRAGVQYRLKIQRNGAPGWVRVSR